MSQFEPTLDTLFIDIAPSHTETLFRCFAELVDRAFTLDDPHAPPGLDTNRVGILYPLDVDPSPIKAILCQNTPAREIQMVIHFQTRVVECQGQANLPVEPELIERARKEIELHLRAVLRGRKERGVVRQLQPDLAWRDFVKRLTLYGIPAHSCSDHNLCPLCKARLVSCTSCHMIICLNRACRVSHLVPFQSCARHASTAACVPCLESVRGIPPLGQCPDCRLWFCQAELTWCLGRPKGGSNIVPTRTSLPNAAREHPTMPVGCSSCIGLRDRLYCANKDCWSRLGGCRVCASCSPGGGLWCTCEQSWICDDCTRSPTQRCFKTCPRCKRVYCVSECDYIPFCAECGRTALCDDCDEEEGAAGTETEGVSLRGVCHSEGCTGRFCGACLEGVGCAGCGKTFCRLCMHMRWCELCNGRFCVGCKACWVQSGGGYRLCSGGNGS